MNTMFEEDKKKAFPYDLTKPMFPVDLAKAPFVFQKRFRKALRPVIALVEHLEKLVIALLFYCS